MGIGQHEGEHSGHRDLCGTYAYNPKNSNPLKWFKNTSKLKSSDIAYVKQAIGFKFQLKGV